MKLKEIKYAVTSNVGSEEKFDSKHESLQAINDSMLGSSFKIYKVVITRTLVKTVNKKRPRPCYGGWRLGHSVPESDLKNESKFTFCNRCGYLLKLVYRNFTDGSYILAKPLIHKNDENLVCKKCGSKFNIKRNTWGYLAHIGNCKGIKK